MAIGDADGLCAQDSGSKQTPSGYPASPGERSLPLGTIDSDTRWAFRALSPVTVSSPIVRLGDVVQPLNPNTAGWQRLRRSPIGLLPLGSQPMTIQRDRLERAVLNAEATPLAIDWIGPEKIEVTYVEAAPKSVVARERAEMTTPAVAQASYQTDVPESASAAAASSSPVSESVADRIGH